MKVKHRSSGSKLILHRAATTKQELIAGRGSLLLRIKVPASVPAGVELTLQLKYAMTGLLVNDPGEWNQSSWTYVVDMDGVSTGRFTWIWIDMKALGWGRKWNEIHLTVSAPVTYSIKAIALCPSQWPCT